MKFFWFGAGCLASAALFYVISHFDLTHRVDAGPSPSLVSAAQRSSVDGLKPNWLGMSGDRRFFESVRNRSYIFCFKKGAVVRSCATEQDDAIRSAVMALNIAQAQQAMPNKARLGLKEREVADHPEIAARIRTYCRNLYIAHGAMDARILSVCFGNLTDFSPLVPLPVP